MAPAPWGRAGERGCRTVDSPPSPSAFLAGARVQGREQTPGDRSKFYFRFGGVLIAQPGGGESGLHRARRARTHLGIRIYITAGGAPPREAGRPAPPSGWLRPPGCSRRHPAPFPFSHLGERFAGCAGKERPRVVIMGKGVGSSLPEGG